MSTEDMLEEARKKLRNTAYILAGTNRDDDAKRQSAIEAHEKAALAFATAAMLHGAK